MKVIPHTRNTKTTFQDLALGDCYRTENGTMIYMKIKASTVNAVSIATGRTFKHNDYYKVFQVKGHFVEEESNMR